MIEKVFILNIENPEVGMSWEEVFSTREEAETARNEYKISGFINLTIMIKNIS